MKVKLKQNIYTIKDLITGTYIHKVSVEGFTPDGFYDSDFNASDCYNDEDCIYYYSDYNKTWFTELEKAKEYIANNCDKQIVGWIIEQDTSSHTNKYLPMFSVK